MKSVGKFLIINGFLLRSMAKNHKTWQVHTNKNSVDEFDNKIFNFSDTFCYSSKYFYLSKSESLAESY